MGSTANDGEPRPQLTRGDQILIHGLAAKPELNGKMGLVQDWIEERGRYTVDIGSILIALRPKNIRKPPRDLKTPVVGASVASAAKVALATPAPQLVAGEAVRIVRLMSKRELNGQEGTVLDWDSSKCRFTVRVASGARYALKRRNLVRSVRTPAKRKRRVHSLPEEGEEGEEGDSGESTECESDDLDAGGAPPDPSLMQSEHTYVGRRLLLRHGSTLIGARVTGWYPADMNGEDEALWHVVHDDGDEEDLDEQEVCAAIKLAEVTGDGRNVWRGNRRRVATQRLVDSLERQTDSAVRFYLAGHNDWIAFASRVGKGKARNGLRWSGSLPVPAAPGQNGTCWLLPSTDAMAQAVGRHAQLLRASGWLVATSTASLIEQLGNKARLREHAERLDMLKLLPVHYSSASSAQYPCVLKAARGEFGRQTYLVHDAAEVKNVMASGEGGDEWLLQELVRGHQEHATSLLLRHGEVIALVNTRYEYDCDVYVWPHVKEVRTKRTHATEIPAAHLAHFHAMLEGYHGICNVNYKVNETGELRIFEINTRVGADLACDVPPRMLQAFLAQLDTLRGATALAICLHI